MIKRANLAFLHDVIMAALCVPLAFVLRMGIDGFLSSSDEMIFAIPMFVLVAGVTFQLSGMYRGIWRYASIPDLVTILKSVTIAVVIFVPILFQFNRLDSFPRSFPIIQFLVLLPMLGGPRMLYRMLRDYRFVRGLMSMSTAGNNGAIPVLLVGTGPKAEMFVRAVLKDPHGRYSLSGILGEADGERKGRSIHGVKVLGTYLEFEKVLSDLNKHNEKPQRLVFTETFDSEQNPDMMDLAREAEKNGLLPSHVPEYTSFENLPTDGALALKPIAIEDLLGRPQTVLDTDAIAEFIKGQKVLITGCGGSIGSELVRQIVSFAPGSVLLLDNCEYNLYAIDQELQQAASSVMRKPVLCDIRHAQRLETVFQDYKPDLVFHAAALKHVPMVELNPAEGILTNVLGTQNVADMAAKYSVKAMVQISTDKAVNPTNIMGASKRLGEFYSQALDLKDQADATRFMTVRFGNVLGSSGSVVPLFKKQLEEGGPITVTHPEIRRYFMTIREAVGLILQASAYGMSQEGERGQIFVLDMGEPIKILDIAHKMIHLANLELDKDISVVFTGLRPGEKLFEELFDQSETPIKTGSKGVLAAVPQPVNVAILRKSFKTLEDAANKNDLEKMKAVISKFVPGFVCDAGTVSAVSDETPIKEA